MCASTVVRIFQGFAAVALFYLSGEHYFSSGFGSHTALFALLGAWLAWQAATGTG